MPRIEEARRTSLRRWLAFEHGLCVGHRVPALLERLAHRGEVLWPLGSVKDLARTLIGLERLLVALLCLLGRLWHLNVDIERADVVAQGNEVLFRRGTHFFPLPLVPGLVSEEGHRTEP